MPRRSFVLLMLIMLAGLWTPHQGTKAQTGCPEGGCKVFLPLVRNNVVATAAVIGFASPRYCFGIYVSVAVTNASIEPIMKVQLSGNVGTSGDSKQYSFVETTQDILFPGETNYYSYEVETHGDQFCADDNVTASVRVTGASTAPHVQSVDVLSRTLVLKSLCHGVYTYQISGTTRNTSAEPLKNIRVLLLRYQTQLFIDVGQPTLAPGESVEFTAQYKELSDLVDGQCYQVSRTIAQETYIVRSWGEAAP